MSAGRLQRRIWEVAGLVGELPASPIACHRAGELTDAFRALVDVRDPEERQEIEERIWSIWCDHADALARTAMARAVDDISSRRLDAAEGKLDALVEARPDWAEAWNKRATLSFLRGHDEQSVDDIERTLRLEPRHFGALGGFAQICLRNGCVGRGGGRARADPAGQPLRSRGERDDRGGARREPALCALRDACR